MANRRHLRVVALQLVKHELGGTVHSMSQHWGYWSTDSEALGSAISKASDMKPGFAVSQWLISAPFAEAGAPAVAPERAKGGYARAAALTPERRSEIARDAAMARWADRGDAK